MFPFKLGRTYVAIFNHSLDPVITTLTPRKAEVSLPNLNLVCDAVMSQFKTSSTELLTRRLYL
jgi:hypothetical protein